MLILASKSPRRQELLKRIYPAPFLVMPADIDEKGVKAESLEKRPLAICLAKGQKISLLHPADIVLSADTNVICDGKEFGKPADAEQARSMLSELNENPHQVITGYAFTKNGKTLLSGLSVSVLILHSLTPELIEAYIKTGSPFDKAGAYGIQDENYLTHTLLEGSYDNVMGFPSQEIKAGLIKLGLI